MTKKFIRHSRESGNPVDNKIPYNELIYRLDSRFRGNYERDSFLFRARFYSQGTNYCQVR